MFNLDEAIKHCEDVAEEKEGQAWEAQLQEEYGMIKSCKECASEHRQLAEWLRDYKRLKEQESCEDEYIKVPKKALKYRTAEMVAYNAEWLKNHFDMERAVICGVQQPCEDAVSRGVFEQVMWERDIAIEQLEELGYGFGQKIEPNTGHWKRISIDKYSEHSKYWYRCNRCGKDNLGNTDWCPNCGARMVEPNMSENPTGSKDVIWYSKRNYSEIVVKPQGANE